MKGYILDYVNENEFRKLERALKKINMVAFKKLNYEYYRAIRNGEFIGELVSTDKKAGIETYEIKLPSDKMFTQIHGEVKLIYTVHKNEKVVMLETLTPEDILLEGHRGELTTYKGIIISNENYEKDKQKIDSLFSDNSLCDTFKSCNYLGGEKINMNSDHQKIKKTNQILIDKILTEYQKEKFANYINKNDCLDMIAEFFLSEEQKQDFFDEKVNYLVNEVFEFDDLEHIKNCNQGGMKLENFIDLQCNK